MQLEKSQAKTFKLQKKMPLKLWISRTIRYTFLIKLTQFEKTG